MSNDELVYQTLSKSGVPGMRASWGPHPPSGPYFVYSADLPTLYADNSNFAGYRHYTATLYLPEWDEGIVERFEDQVRTFGSYSRKDGYSDSHERFYASFKFSIIRPATSTE